MGQILGPFMITRGLSCDRVGFGLIIFFWGGGGGGGGVGRPSPSSLATGLVQYFVTNILEMNICRTH